VEQKSRCSQQINRQHPLQDPMLMNNEELLKYYNEYFAWLPDYEIVNYFVIEEVGSDDNDDLQIFFVGKISSNLAKKPLEIDIKIPLGFPNEKLSLTTTSLRNYAHLIPNNDESSWFCLNTPFCETIEEQLDHEMERLSGWIDKYLNKGEKHELPPISFRNNDFTLSYNEVIIKEGEEPHLKETCWGISDCYEVDGVLYPKNLGNKFFDVLKKFTDPSERKLFWLFSEKTPMKEDGSLPSDLKELNDVLSLPDALQDVFKKYFRINLTGPCLFQNEEETVNEDSLSEQDNIDNKDIQAKDLIISDYWNITEDVLLAIGFKFDNIIQWELLRVKCNAVTVSISNEKNKKENVVFLKQYGKEVYFVIEWMKTANIYYENYFGRGRFCNNIVDSKIAIIGIGAIGSELAEILVRGGIKDLLIIDDDIVEHGNICRSNYQFLNVGKSKTASLSQRLITISPYINVQLIKKNIYSEINYNSKKEINNFLNQADIIFECTASNELLHCLSMLDLKKQIISFGITNEARDMICVTNSKDNLFEQRKFFLKQLEHDTENLYYEGIGCYTPTFRANFADINSLLNLAIKHIDKSFSNKMTVDSFVLSHTDIGIIKNNIITLNQKELGFTLSISQHCLDEIEHYSYKHYPLEFGGFLLGGYSRDMKRIYITNILIAENKINGPAFFQPIDNSSVHKKITKIFDKTHGLINYIGEWHTHPEMGNFYSGTDFDSIKKQAKSKNIFTNNPLLCVVSVGRRYFEPKFYIYYNNNLYEFSK
jgi:integrative and conjugative element protein (TIGR02256 family)